MRSMFAIFFTFMFVTAYAANEIPSYIHPCGRKDPNYSQCFADNINSVKSYICTGIPELNFPPQEPLIIDNIDIFDTDNLKLFLKNSKLRGICNFDITSHNVSSDRLHFEFSVTIKNISMDSVYNFDIRLLQLPLANEGIIHITLDNVNGKISIDAKEVIKNGKKQLYLSKVNSILNIKTFNYEFDESEKDLHELHKIFIEIINKNLQEIINIVTPKLEKTMSKLLIFVTNTIVYNRFEQLFPDEA
ncbi:uncharacterized protein LOC105835004 [Monomorium pharaonis]|uniref:uncharacterized protein LOC105835004 n=1 Tax=Monomorium pharaonis TaxID=307658 RepID=UPI001746D4A2|nr:uncharacterized protein LOC105835004 [Monomorium pharaonis]